MKYTKEKIEEAVKNSINISEVVRYLGIKSKSGSLWSHIKKKIKDYNIDTSHFKGNKSYLGKTPKGGFDKKSAKNILIKGDKKLPTYQVRRALIESGKIYKCEKCNQEPIWQNKKLTIEVDHINGNNKDNRISNLRFLCPNCHSQTKNYGTKKIKKINKCNDCKCEISKKAKRCRKCSVKYKDYSEVKRNTKINWPSHKELLEMNKNLSKVEMAKKLGVSETAIRRRLKKK